MARLIISSPDKKRGILELIRPVVTIGRSNANDLVLNDASVSRFHAVIKQLPNRGVMIADRSSTNGVLLNGQRISAETALRDGDIARMGIYELKFEDMNDSALVVHKAQMPAHVEHVLHGHAPGSHKAEETPSTLADMIEHIRKLQRENYLLTVLYDCGKALVSKLSLDDIADQVMALAFRMEGVERGFMMLFDENGEVQHQTEVRYRRPPSSHQPQIILSRSILERIKTEQQPILIQDLSSDERFQASESMKISGLRSAMCAPLPGSSRLFGILYVDNLEKTAAFTQEELNVFSLLAAQTAAAIDNARAQVQLADQAVQRSALERFLSPEVVKMVAANPKGIRLGGVNQKVSILFADIRGFTTLSENMPPEKVVELLNEYFTRVTDVVFDFGGTLDKYLGDGIMALFGAPISKGNDASNAVRAAITLQRLMQQLNRDAPSRGWPQLKIGVGINTGVVTAGNIGSPRRIDYTVIGDPVNVASRLMSHASGGEILISAATVAELDVSFSLQALKPLLVRGKSEPLRVFKVEWSERAASASR